ncbi:hypothetical protein [Wenxinia marina]|uniref:Pentapeptide repeat-containing protein n=1 Tax=Wenxinia marina DSM 24838 TaxID=1123501 RepID=A0A0D0PHB6_9RHOB|nr:hypothetical protein [Wenxinia marina]KIQ70711.1 hypothetical protein Wenmar_01089 [Wenxinia marina DSM 24838]GGL51192.1 hypothetical protein GCM10011392_01650 [Wenxinia marina]
MTLPDLTPDCTRCDALCCSLLAFDEGEMFAFDKPAGQGCRHLCGTRCTVHDRLAEEGMHGCVRFDCQGAGQRLMQGLFAGQSWRDGPQVAERIASAFRDVRAVHAALDLLVLAGRLPLSAPAEADRRRLLSSLSADPADEAALAALATRAPEAHRFLRSLAGEVARGGAGR